MQVKGIAVRSIKEFVEKLYHHEYRNWLQALPEESRKIFSSPIDVSQWYPVQHASIEPTKLIGKMFFNGSSSQAAYESGRFSAQMALTGIYKVFVMIATPAFIIGRASRIMTSYYQPASIIVKETKEKLCVVHILELPEKNQLIEIRISGWISKAFEITGCKEVKVETPKSLSRNDPYTEIVIRWS
jgi:hypothetical protein